MSTDLNVRPEVTLQVITPALVRASIHRARRSLEKAAEEIVWQIEMEGWRTLGYTSWGAMREAEYGGAAFMVPSGSRPEIVARIKEIEVGKTARGGSKHLTNQEIADTVGVSERQVRDDLKPDDKSGNSAGFVNTDTGEVTDSEDGVVDAEIVDDDPTPSACPAPRDDEPFGWERTYKSFQELAKHLKKNPSPEQRERLARGLMKLHKEIMS